MHMKKYLLLLLAALTFVACSDEDELVERNFSETYFHGKLVIQLSQAPLAL